MAIRGEAPDTVRGQAPDPMREAADPMREAVEEAADEAERTGGLGRPGRALNRHSPFFIGMTAAAGVAVTYGIVELIVRARSVLILIGLALFIAAACRRRRCSPTGWCRIPAGPG